MIAAEGGLGFPRVLEKGAFVQGERGELGFVLSHLFGRRGDRMDGARDGRCWVRRCGRGRPHDSRQGCRRYMRVEAEFIKNI